MGIAERRRRVESAGLGCQAAKAEGMDVLGPTCTCGQILAREITSLGIVTTEGRAVPFRRSTDFLGCPECLEVTRVIDLRQEDIRMAAERELSLLSAG